MNKEELMDMARECGMKEGCSSFGPDWLATNAMLEKLYNTILERAAVEFNQPHMEYFGHEIQETIRALKTQGD